ncbi:MAG: GNAT family N-acetyltransferase [Fibrobacteria bacterium]
MKIADQEGEFEQIFRLNYLTFVEEIPQHAGNQAGMLVDRFHAENRYLICLDQDELLGMVALRDRRPFSLDEKIPGLCRQLPFHVRAVEIRLLAVQPSKRHSPVFGLLMKRLLRICAEEEYEVGLISGRIENIPLYRKFGFLPFGPKVGAPGAWYQPMRIDRVALNRSLAIAPRISNVTGRPETLNFLPGPVAHSQRVKEALSAPVFSHRSDLYSRSLRRCKTALLEATGAGAVEILMGTGTLANDIIAGQLSLLPGKGLVISNGEFGERLILHAQGFQLRYQTHRQTTWATDLEMRRIAAILEADPGITWIWAAHCETSTGQLNPIAELKSMCRRYGVALCLDCISSLGVVPVDLMGVEFASGVSGKGLGAFTGLALVFSRKTAVPAPERLPRYLDLGNYAGNGGISFSGSSNLLSALEASLSERLHPAFLERIAADSLWLRAALREAGIGILVREEASSPAIFTLPLPAGLPSLECGARLEAAGVLLNYQGAYLTERNWLQVCLMADHGDSALGRLMQALKEAWSGAERAPDLDGRLIRPIASRLGSAIPFCPAPG